MCKGQRLLGSIVSEDETEVMQDLMIFLQIALIEFEADFLQVNEGITDLFYP